jgi:hypothetical protein
LGRKAAIHQASFTRFQQTRPDKKTQTMATPFLELLEGRNLGKWENERPNFMLDNDFGPSHARPMRKDRMHNVPPIISWAGS